MGESVGVQEDLGDISRGFGGIPGGSGALPGPPHRHRSARRQEIKGLNEGEGGAAHAAQHRDRQTDGRRA